MSTRDIALMGLTVAAMAARPAGQEVFAIHAAEPEPTFTPKTTSIRCPICTRKFATNAGRAHHMNDYHSSPERNEP